MGLSLKESRAIAEIAELFYDYLPGSGSPKWKGHVSFKTITEKVGVGDFWQPGSKTPMIVALLEYRRGRFEPLMLEIVRAGLPYRQKSGNPVDPSEIDKLNGLIPEVGFKFPDLWDPDFKASLKADAGVRAKKRVEEVLNRLFTVHALSPREAFRVVGEQIDGSFLLDHEVYLLEAKWTQDPSPEADLLIFRGKIEGKSKYTRGVFVTINGVSKEAAIAITQGKQPNFFIIDGYDLTMLLEDNIELTEFLRMRQRLLAEEGQVIVPFNQLDMQC